MQSLDKWPRSVLAGVCTGASQGVETSRRAFLAPNRRTCIHLRGVRPKLAYRRPSRALTAFPCIASLGITFLQHLAPQHLPCSPAPPGALPFMQLVAAGGRPWCRRCQGYAQGKAQESSHACATRSPRGSRAPAGTAPQCPCHHNGPSRCTNSKVLTAAAAAAAARQPAAVPAGAAKIS